MEMSPLVSESFWQVLVCIGFLSSSEASEVCCGLIVS